MKKETYGMLIDVLSVIAGNLIIALGVNLFILPSDILSGGVAGIAVALQPVFHLPATLVINGLTIGLFIVGADNHVKGVGERLADFVISHDICGVLIQSMYFVPGTPVYKTHKNKLIHTDWSKYNGNVVHYPEKIAPDDLQREIISPAKEFTQ